MCGGIGCQLRHGSNVAALATTATYDPKTDTFTVNTPDEGAIKWWIGNAAVDGLSATVFARLLLPDPSAPHGYADKGIHAFVVPLRNPATRQPMPGVEIRDCGYKVGLNGVDNGALKFSHVVIPRDHLLDRFARVAPGGAYDCDFKRPEALFAAMLGELTGGRVGLVVGSTQVLKMVTTIAIRYSAVRQQFGPPGEPEICILDYQSQQDRLMPLLAASYAFTFVKDHLVQQYAKLKTLPAGVKDPDLQAQVHSLSAGLKSYVTAFTAAAINTCRESCGGHGYAAVNRFGSLRNDHGALNLLRGPSGCWAGLSGLPVSGAMCILT